ncbi:hypothetical protein FZEAL_8762 [Fusarium zealandicum]|uniref:Uncharacterized protein n=1 Tax=Fusarium zealandicum TaxID=1053134 RepID=A0A8H4UDM1_9HYPO|nr:hypothetical protein FZEAL_8762 [Fusarium zealandicum]
MWLPTPSVESLTRPRLAVAVVSAVAAISVGYYAYQSHASLPFESLPGGGLHRSNAVRRPRRARRNETGSSSSSEAAGDENAEIDTVRPLGDGETVVEGGDEWWNDPGGFPSNQRAGHNIVNLLFRVSEDNARRNGCVHRGCQCNACGMVPIRGVRYRCAHCADFDLCETCEAQGVHIKTHIFYKIRVPAPPFGPRQMQPVWYTGDPDTCRRNLPRGLIPKLSHDTGFERPELEAFWEQWTFMANSEWRDDPDELGLAMDRKTFERCLVPTGGSRHAAPNLIHERMFSFYDSNNDDLIGFTEFLHGLSYRKRKDKLRKIFMGYDLDADGYVDRKDFLRMFRAYYVLYKQMHKDILDGLEDQLLASTEAQQLVTSRQPLSSLFGREGRVPAGDGAFRHEGKTYHRDGSVDIADGHEGVVAQDQGDTAARGDILTSLFACETDQRSRSRFITRSDTDTNWRTVRRLSGSEVDRTYWVSLLGPPSTLEELPDLVLGNRNLEIEEPTDDEGDDETRNGNGLRGDGDNAAGPSRIESEIRAEIITTDRTRAPRLDKRKRDMARKQLHERWRRRQFYLDEEEGGYAPDDWAADEDILMDLRKMDEASSADEPASPTTPSSPRVKLANSKAGDEGVLGESTSPSSASERIPRWRIPEVEHDAGKEILYQVTQQAFNELLDTIFKPAEDLSVQAAETKEQRERYKDVLDTIELGDDDGANPSTNDNGDSKVRSDADKSLEELLSETGYTIALPEGRNAVEIETTVEIMDDHEETKPTLKVAVEAGLPGSDYRDPTLPQFRPNTQDEVTESPSQIWYPITRPIATDTAEENPDREDNESSSPPTSDMLRHWKRLSLAEAQAIKRGGWGKLSFHEFEAIYKSQEHQGNRLDYLGSWIDFCIP